MSTCSGEEADQDDEERMSTLFCGCCIGAALYALPNTATAGTCTGHSNASEPIALTTMDTPALNCLDAMMNYGTPFRHRPDLPEPVLECPHFVNAFFGREQAHVLCFSMSGSQAIHASLQASFRLTQARQQAKIALSTWYGTWGYLACFQPPHLLRQSHANTTHAPEGIQSVRDFIGYHTDYTPEYDAALVYWLEHQVPQPDDLVSWTTVRDADWRTLCAILTGLDASDAAEVADMLLVAAREGTWDGAPTPRVKELVSQAEKRGSAVNAFLIELVLSSADSAMPIAWARLISRLCALFHIVLTVDEAMTCCRTGPGIFLAGMLGVMPTMSIFSKALFPSGVVWHASAPPKFRIFLAADRVAPYPTAWLTVSLATEMKALMTRLDSPQLTRNFLQGRIVRHALSSARLPQTCVHAQIRGVGLLVFVDGAAVHSGPGGTCFKHKRLILPFDLTGREIKNHLTIRTQCPQCTGGTFGAARTGGATRSRAAAQRGMGIAEPALEDAMIQTYLEYTHRLAHDRGIDLE